jgi:ketosteroid isomerase-like protein
MNQPKTSEEHRNATVIRELYASADAAAKDTPRFVSMFGEGGYFYDVGAGKKYYGKDIGYTVDNYAIAFPDMHRELYNMYFNDDVVIVEPSLNGTHKADLETPEGVILATNKQMQAPCCDVFHLKDGKVVSFHCYVAVSILLKTTRDIQKLERCHQARLKHPNQGRTLTRRNHSQCRPMRE